MALDASVALVTGASARDRQGDRAGAGARRRHRSIGTATTDAGAAAIGAYLNEAGNSGAGMRLDFNEATGTDGDDQRDSVSATAMSRYSSTTPASRATTCCCG